ncbi:hypothetical protein Huta_2593 [Halorhabdus utahensis DSM 12940]|uniref:Uncharacterized protein n=1 Tax=Halorhabdus utahensis (strain DSM 12940 / JCM 11049 / AX-2) TaxID=519442 RepID=C7NPK0_HALUD|nr:hypothetical protein [Halorhabdus utahensis]ACV12755.1 hypothetical protein Huta_2593 [Halorhabdus utahensis DSM 12940]
MPTIDHCVVTAVDSRLVYGRVHEAAPGRDDGATRVCFRRSDNVLVREGEAISIEYRYERPGEDRLPTLLVDVTSVWSAVA